ncbi:MAG: Crp/Fnr family transcriptional regulator [Candidatus Levybacteria bacterium]|nr:Crp/Fnr family transcriptional regulator [Candidatus Levybacteria bacterium]
MSAAISQRLNEFFSKFKNYHYKKGEVILRGGDAPQGVYYINKGYVRDYSASKEGQELTLIIFKPEDFFPINWVLNDAFNLHYFEAMTAVELWRCPREEFATLLKANPDVFFEMASHVALRLGGLLQRMEYLAFGNAYEKVASILMICAERFGEKSEKGMLIPIPLTHKDIAMLVGMTRETVSIEMKKLERKKIVTYRGRYIIVRDQNKLKKESLLNDL